MALMSNNAGLWDSAALDTRDMNMVVSRGRSFKIYTGEINS